MDGSRPRQFIFSTNAYTFFNYMREYTHQTKMHSRNKNDFHKQKFIEVEEVEIEINVNCACAQFYICFECTITIRMFTDTHINAFSVNSVRKKKMHAHNSTNKNSVHYYNQT